MPCIHPSETPPLGWLVPCLAVADLAAAIGFYAKLDFEVCGGDVARNWATLRSRAIEIHLFQGHIPRDLPNFRGADVSAVRAALAERGLAVAKEFGPSSVIYRDPDGRDVFFDSAPDEVVAYESGRPLSVPVPGPDVHAGEGLDLGNLVWCLTSRDPAATQRFYETLGMVVAGGDISRGWSVLGRADQPMVPGRRQIGPCLSLFRETLPRDTIDFRGGDVAAIASVLAERGVPLGEGVVIAPDGGESLEIEDPDGRPVCFDTMPQERLVAR